MVIGLVLLIPIAMVFAAAVLITASSKLRGFRSWVHK
jgi:hypothetical protein